MSIPELLRGIMRQRGYSSVEDMAVRESIRHGEPILPNTLKTWMSLKPGYRRIPRDGRSLRILGLIAGISTDEALEMAEADARDTSAGKSGPALAPAR